MILKDLIDVLTGVNKLEISSVNNGSEELLYKGSWTQVPQKLENREIEQISSTPKGFEIYLY